MKKLLAVIDMQNDFIDAALGTKEAESIVEKAAEKIKNFDGEIVYTMDTHAENYLDTQEGAKLPVIHCIKGSNGWELNSKIKPLSEKCRIFEKGTFGSKELAEYIACEKFDSIELIGLCTDICVISNALIIKAFVPEADVSVDSRCCAGVTPQSHENALEAMRMCQINVK